MLFPVLHVLVLTPLVVGWNPMLVTASISEQKNEDGGRNNWSRVVWRVGGICGGNNIMFTLPHKDK